MAAAPTIFLLLTLLSTTAATQHHHHRHLLHQPFFPLTSFPPLLPPSPSPSPQPQSQSPQQPKYPFSSTPTTPNTASSKPFFPTYPNPPPPPSPNSLTTFPANISSVLFPHSSKPSPFSRHKFLIISLSLSLLSAALIFVLVAFLLHHHYLNHPTKTSHSDNLRLFTPDTSTSDSYHHKPPATASTSSEFLNLGTLFKSGGVDEENASSSSNVGVGIGGLTSLSASGYRKLGSPELKPLPPLPRHNFKQNYRNAEVGFSGNEQDDDEEEEFFSPRGSSGRKEDSPVRTGSQRIFGGVEAENFGNRSWNSRTPSYPSPNSVSSTSSLPLNLSSTSLKSKSPDSIIDFPAPSRSPLAPPRPKRQSLSTSSPEIDSGNTQNSPTRNSDFSGQNRPSPTKIESFSNRFVPKKLPPPPPPLPRSRFWETAVPRPIREPNLGPPPMRSIPAVSQKLGPILLTEESENNENTKNKETPKPKLKPLHWDKVRASSDRAMVWDQLKSSSFQLNEEMIETLFMVNNTNLTPKDNVRRQVIPSQNQENQVLDPKKSQNVAILLRALNVTVDEVCEALLEGNADTLGTELLESLLKMAPTNEEERKLKGFKDESPFKLGPAEKFLKAVLDIPFAFKRVDAMLYIANFDSEVEYLIRSFETLEAACEELRNSRIFLKLLEAVLKTGNRMNVGTNRGDAQAFKLDTLLKLVDVKGTDGKTTLLHFVVQEMIRAEGSRLSGAKKSPKTEPSQQSAVQDDVEFRKLGLQVVAGLSGELTNVKKAAAMDSDVLSSEVSKLASGITKIVDVVKLNEEIALKESSRKFSESMNGFLKKAEEDIIRIQAHESVAVSLVKELAEYFHGNSAKEEAHPFRFFLVVRDFLSILDQVCKEVGKINERTIVSSSRQFPVAVYPTLPLIFPGFGGKQQYGSSDDESSLSS